MPVRHALGIVLVLAACQATDKKTPPPTKGPSSELATPSSSSPLAGSANTSEVIPAQRSAPPLPDPLPGKRTTLPSIGDKTWRIAIGDLDGNHKNEIVACDADFMTVLDASGKKLGELKVVDGIQKLVVVDLDGDG